ncbi:MAG: cobalamin-dependent protein [Desulfobacteraceae bacterium]|nr:cobalamin-dependent protein [Desulfobacteraceae bacterium]
MEILNLSQERKDLLDSLKDAILVLDEEKAKEVAENIINEKINPTLAIKYSIANAAIKVGEKFDSGEYYLPHLVMAGDLMEAVSAILEKNISAEQIEQKKVIVIGTVQADMHSVGKNIVSTMLKAGGFEVHDMGVDVPSMSFIEKAKEVRADIIALSSLLTTTMPYQREVIEDLASMGIRDKFKVMVGGGPVTKAYAEEIGADGYGKDAIEALEEAKKLLS